MRRRYIWCIVAFMIVCIIWLRLLLNELNIFIPPTKHKFDNFDNVTGAEEVIVPNVIHFILFGQNSLDFVSFLSILSVLKVHTMVFLLLNAADFHIVINKVVRCLHKDHNPVCVIYYTDFSL
jgi:hypothetical protein